MIKGRDMHKVIPLMALWMAVSLTSAHAQTAFDASGAPLLIAQGGGFVFNYREARAHYGLAVKPQKAMPPGAVVEARFEDPGGGPAWVAIRTFDGTPRPIILETPAVTGIRKGVDYHVTVEVKRPDGTVLGAFSRTYQSDLDQAILPAVPLVIGPGYEPNPAASPSLSPQ